MHHAWIEGYNLDMAFPVPWKQGQNLAEANLTAMWSNYKAHGHTRLIYVNTASVLPQVVDALTTAMGDDPVVSGVFLTSSDAVAERRLVQREVGWTTRCERCGRPTPEDFDYFIDGSVDAGGSCWCPACSTPLDRDPTRDGKAANVAFELEEVLEEDREIIAGMKDQ